MCTARDAIRGAAYRFARSRLAPSRAIAAGRRGISHLNVPATSTAPTAWEKLLLNFVRSASEQGPLLYDELYASRGDQIKATDLGGFAALSAKSVVLTDEGLQECRARKYRR